MNPRSLVLENVKVARMRIGVPNAKPAPTFAVLLQRQFCPIQIKYLRVLLEFL